MRETSNFLPVFIETFFWPYSRIEKFKIIKLYNKLNFKNIAVTEPAAAYLKPNFNVRIRKVLNKNIKKYFIYSQLQPTRLSNCNPHSRKTTLVSIPLLQEIVFKTF